MAEATADGRWSAGLRRRLRSSPGVIQLAFQSLAWKSPVWNDALAAGAATPLASQLVTSHSYSVSLVSTALPQHSTNVVRLELCLSLSQTSLPSDRATSW